MHGLLRIDKKRLVISPFDHFRRGQIECPAFVIFLDGYPRLAEWAQKQFDGFLTSGGFGDQGAPRHPPRVLKISIVSIT